MKLKELPGFKEAWPNWKENDRLSQAAEVEITVDVEALSREIRKNLMLSQFYKRLTFDEQASMDFSFTQTLHHALATALATSLDKFLVLGRVGK